MSSIILCLFTLWIPSRIDMAGLQWLHRFLNDRGFAQQLALYIIIRNILAVTIAKTRKVLPTCYTRQLLAFSIIPLLLGIVGAIRGITITVGSLAYYLEFCPNSPTSDGAYSVLLRAMGLSMDNLLLGLIGTFISCFFYVLALTSKKMIVQQCVPPLRRTKCAEGER